LRAVPTLKTEKGLYDPLDREPLRVAGVRRPTLARGRGWAAWPVRWFGLTLRKRPERAPRGRPAASCAHRHQEWERRKRGWGGRSVSCYRMGFGIWSWIQKAKRTGPPVLSACAVKSWTGRRR